MTVTDYTDGYPSFNVTPGVSVWMTFSGGNSVLRADKLDSSGSHVQGSILATYTGSVMVQTAAAPKDSLVRFWGQTGPFAGRGIAWRGRIRFSPVNTTGNAVNYVPMEQYLRGVVPRESPSSWPTEALKAQAVAARSYAYEAASAGDILYCTTMSQVYNGAGDTAERHETDKTDAAIAATANKYVVYGTKVITTYFSSSSGGRTANSKDVWFSSRDDNDTPVYYTSVTDADNVSGNPNYRWSLANITGTDLGKKIRDYDNGADNTDALDYSAPSPATITNVTMEPGTSGFIRYITFKWSNGASYTLTGPKFKSIMALKSTAFTVVLTNPPPVFKSYGDGDSRLLYSSGWSVVSHSSARGGSYHRASAKGAKLTVMFKGSSIKWIGTKSSRSGKADISLDGTRVATVDLYSSSSAFKAAIWSKAGLADDTTHTIVITVLGSKRSASGGTYVYVDGFDLIGSMVAVPRPPVWKRSDNNASAVRYAGTWKTSTITGLYGGSHAFSSTTSSTATFTFTGTQARWIGKRAANYGKAWVSVDSSPAVLIDLYSSKTLYQQKLFDSGTLAAGTHTLKVRVARSRNTASSGYYVDVDAFDALVPAK
jgi:SpoIID/LytB domain protein